MRLKFTLQYQGHGYGGWQFQPAAGAPVLPSIQGDFCAALNNLLGDALILPKDIIAAGRTDAGVHAWGQVVHIDVPEHFAARPAHSWVEGMNRFLPDRIRVVAAEIVDASFHARHSARQRAYVYRLWVGRQLRPDLLHVAGHAVAPFGTTLNLAAMAQAVASLPVGIATDFTSFRDAECQAKSPVCTLAHAQLESLDGNLLEFHIAADRFLHHMVRNLVGTLVEVGLGTRAPDMRPLLELRDRRKAGPTFAPDGLFFKSVSYT